MRLYCANSLMGGRESGLGLHVRRKVRGLTETGTINLKEYARLEWNIVLNKPHRSMGQLHWPNPKTVAQNSKTLTYNFVSGGNRSPESPCGQF